MINEDKLIKGVFLFCFILLVSLFFVSIIDTLTIKEIGEKSVPCLDEYHRPFEDEMCTKTIYCSWLGFIQNKRCSDLEVDE